jgi:hypothetical protein
MAGAHEQQMQKALERMNLKIHDVISDLTGMSGLKMVEAIVAGERNPVALLALCDPQIQKTSGAAARGTGRHLERRTPLCPASGLRVVAVLSEEDRRV